MSSSDPHGHHDWHSREYVDSWISRDVTRDEERRPLLQRVAELIPHDESAAIRALDVGAGYGALSERVLARFPRATLVCQDFSDPMFAHARERLAGHAERVSFAKSNLMDASWTRDLDGPCSGAGRGQRARSYWRIGGRPRSRPGPEPGQRAGHPRLSGRGHNGPSPDRRPYRSTPVRSDRNDQGRQSPTACQVDNNRLPV